MNDYSESSLVELPAIELFQSLGYEHQNCFNEKFGESGTLGRETPSDVVLISRLKSALSHLNPDLSEEAIDHAIEELCRDRSSQNPVIANRELYRMLKDGLKGWIRMEDGSEEIETLKVIDFDNPETNDFFLASQFWVTGEMYKRRADLVGFVNGLPLIFIELKATHKRLENAYRKNLEDYKSTIPPIFWYNAFIILSNASRSRIGTITSDWEHFSDWKKIGGEEEEEEEGKEVGIVSLDTIIRGTCDKSRFMDILENFILFQDTGGAVIKIIAKNHQYLGVNSAINKLIATLTPDPSPKVRGEMGHYRGGFQFAGLVERARELRKNQTPTEQILWELVRDRRFLNLKFRRQYQIGDYIADFYCHDLTANEKKHVKHVAKRLLGVLKKEKLVLDWRKRQQTRADVVLTIQNILDEGLPRSYTPAVYQHKCDLVYQHVYDAYYGSERSVYAAGAQAGIQ